MCWRWPVCVCVSSVWQTELRGQRHGLLTGLHQDRHRPVRQHHLCLQNWRRLVTTPLGCVLMNAITFNVNCFFFLKSLWFYFFSRGGTRKPSATNLSRQWVEIVKINVTGYINYCRLPPLKLCIILFFPVVLQSAVTCLLWPAEHAIVYGLVDGKVRLQHDSPPFHLCQFYIICEGVRGKDNTAFTGHLNIFGPPWLLFYYYCWYFYFILYKK